MSGTFAQSVQPLFDGKEFEGKRLERIDFDPPTQPMSPAELRELLPLRVGQPLRAADIRHALQLLYDTGHYSDVSIEGTPVGSKPVQDKPDKPDEAAGVAVRISTQFALFVSGVSIVGLASPPNRNSLLNAAKLELGAPFQAKFMEQSVANMQDRMRANGLYRAKLAYQLAPSPETGEMSIRFQLAPGPRTHFAGATFVGKLFESKLAESKSALRVQAPSPLKPARSTTPESLLRATRWRRGFGPILFPGWREVTENRVQDGLNRIRNVFLSENRLQSRVALLELNYTPSSNTITPSIELDAGPVTEVRTTGAKVSRSKLRQLIPIYEERAVEPGLLTEGDRNLVDYFQSKGYFEVAVSHTQTQSSGSQGSQDDRQIIEYNILRNARHKLVAIEITGNHFFDTETLRERISLRENQTLRYRYGRYSPKLRDQDRDLIRDLYRSNGFRAVKVTASTMDNYQGRVDELGVRFEIEEGQPWFISGLQIDGPAPAEVEYLRRRMQSSVGQTFSDSNLAADRDMALSYYFDNGYPNATFDWLQEADGEANRVNLRYTIKPGERQYVRNIFVRGLETTRPQVVQSRLGLKAGDPISQAQIAATQQKLYDSGIFSRVQTALQNPLGQEAYKNVLLQMDEANRYAFNLGFGAELGQIGGGVNTLDAPAGTTGFSPRVSAGISRLNFWGLGHTVNLQGRVSNFQQRAVLSYVVPQLADDPNLSLTYSTLFDSSHDVRTFAARRWEGSIQLARRLSRASTLQARVSYRKVTVGSLIINQGLLPLLSQPDRVGLFALSYIQDRRDNSVDTHRGIYNTIDAGISLPQFGSASSFTRVLLRNSTYHPIGREWVLARTLQFGYQQRLAGLTQIPLAERFFAGGASSQRGFPDNQAGPRDVDSGFPLGGSAMLLHSTELRFPLIGDNIGGVFFHDMGNVYSSIRNVSFRPGQRFVNGARDLQDFDYMVHSVGFGIRYRTPIGPVRVDLSYSPDSPRFHGLKGTIEQLYTNQGTPTDQRISTFQFHFSLGQTF